jgi:CDGSH-type Zn-finger protein
MSKAIFYPGNGYPIVARKQERNALCKCGSGKKAKNCCGTDVKYFLSSKLKAIRRNEDIKRMDAEDKKNKIVLV